MLVNKLSLGLLVGMALTQSCAAQSEIIDISEQFAQVPEASRLRYFEEINLIPVIEDRGLTGNGVRVTIMGEMVDPNHPDINAAVINQFNAFAKNDEILRGSGNQQFRAELLGPGDGHGTHIAGTIAAACDNVGLAGVACGATLDVYALGAYDNADAFRVESSQSELFITDFIGAFDRALADVTRRGESKIVTGSFNLEAPAIINTNPDNFSELEIMDAVFGDSSENLLQSSLFEGVSQADKEMLSRVIEHNGGDPSIALMALAPQVLVFAELADTIATYQNSGGVYIVTESNYQFEDRTSVLNAMPTLMDQVDPDLWLSVVLVSPKGIDEVTNEEEFKTAMAGNYVTPINSCGLMARDYCIVTPSYNVLSTMTQQVYEEALPLLKLDERTYQSFTGHSMGAPMVAAALALMQEHNQNEGLGLTMRDLVRLLKDNANREFSGYNPDQHGRGMLDVEAAIAAMAG